MFTEAEGSFQVAHGIEAKALSGDNYAFVWSGEAKDQIADKYQSHGEGSFSVNPLSGISGFYIGETSLADEFRGQTSGFVKLSSETTQSLSTNLDMAGFLKVGGITAQGRRFQELTRQLTPLAEQSPTMIGQAYLMISTDYLSGYVQGHTYLLTTDTEGAMEYRDITDLNEMSVTYLSATQDLQIGSHVGSVRYISADQDLQLQVLRM